MAFDSKSGVSRGVRRPFRRLQLGIIGRRFGCVQRPFRRTPSVFNQLLQNTDRAAGRTLLGHHITAGIRAQSFDPYGIGQQACDGRQQIRRRPTGSARCSRGWARRAPHDAAAAADLGAPA